MTEIAAMSVATVPLLTSTALAAAVATSRIGRPLSIPPLASDIIEIQSMSTKNTAKRVA